MKPFLDEIEGHRFLNLLHVLLIVVELTAVLERERFGIPEGKKTRYSLKLNPQSNGQNVFQKVHSNKNAEKQPRPK